MKLKLLTPGYKNDERFFTSFVNNTIVEDGYISEAYVYCNEIPSFPIYFGQLYFNKTNIEEKVNGLKTLIKVAEDYVLDMDKDIYMDELFWHSYLCIKMRDYLISKYPKCIESYKNFKNIILKNFMWENYIYKAILIAQYVTDLVPNEKEKYYDLIINNMDIFNYVIKAEFFKNDHFLINILNIIDRTGLSSVLKSQIKGRDDLGKDERYGRRVIFEFNKSYPIVLSPMLSVDELELYFLKYLSYYYSGSETIEAESIEFDYDEEE